MLTEHHLNQFLSVVPVTTAQTVRTTTRALAHVNRTCVQTEREIDEEEGDDSMEDWTNASFG